MAPRKAPKRRGPPETIPETTPVTDSTAQMKQVFAETLATSMPTIISQIMKSIQESTPGGGTGTGAGGSGGFDGSVPNSQGGGGSGSQGPTIVIDDTPKGCSYKTFMGCKPLEFKGTEDAIATLHWMEKTESVFAVCGCADGDRVKFATYLFQGKALTWWNTIVRIRGRDGIGSMTWDHLRDLMMDEYVPIHEVERMEHELWSLAMVGSDIRGYTNRFYELSQLVPIGD